MDCRTRFAVKAEIKGVFNKSYCCYGNLLCHGNGNNVHVLQWLCSFFFWYHDSWYQKWLWHRLIKGCFNDSRNKSLAKCWKLFWATLCNMALSKRYHFGTWLSLIECSLKHVYGLRGWTNNSRVWVETRYRKLTQLQIKQKGSQPFVSIERKKRYKSAVHKFCFWPSHLAGTNRTLGAIFLLTHKKLGAALRTDSDQFRILGKKNHGSVHDQTSKG